MSYTLPKSRRDEKTKQKAHPVKVDALSNAETFQSPLDLNESLGRYKGHMVRIGN